MPTTSPITASFTKPAGLKFRFVAGAGAGNVTVTGIKTTDELLYVGGTGLGEAAPNTFAIKDDLTSEFSISADDTINNTGGTSTAAHLLLVVWATRAPGY